MQAFFPILFASLVGVGHAFEADHLLAVSHIVAKRDSVLLAAKDGLFWGLGHTTTIVVVGAVIILSRATFLTSGYFEAVVGVMLIVMGISRLANKGNFTKTTRYVTPGRYQHGLAYTVGLVHGLAGSGALVLLVMSEMSDALLSITYLLVFGIGSVIGMLLAAGLLSIPFTRRMKISRAFRATIVLLSSVVCILYGGWMVYDTLG